MSLSRRLLAAAMFLSPMGFAMPADAQQEIKTPSGLRYTDNKVGAGKTAAAGRDVEVHYTGWLYQDSLRGKQFDSSRGRDSDYPTINTVRRVDNQISILIQPAQKRLWVTGGPLANGHQNDFQCLDLTRRKPHLRGDVGNAEPGSLARAGQRGTGRRVAGRHDHSNCLLSRACASRELGKLRRSCRP